jgi:hypothetical protein
MRVIPALVVCLAVAGCGTADDRTQARAVTERFVTAFEQHRGQEACEQLSDATAEELETQEQKPCEEAITEVEFTGGTVAKTEVYVTNAKVDLTSGESLFLNREASGWKLSAVGCRATEGAPTDQPLDCELEA